MTTVTERRERPLNQTAEQVRALLDGSRTQARFIIKPQPEDQGDDVWKFRDEVFISSEFLKDHLFHNVYGADDDPAMPYGGVYEGYGDRLWVRETWRNQFALDGHWNCIEFRADGECRCIMARDGGDGDPVGLGDVCESYKSPTKWRPSIHIPRWASRITLELTDVRVEQVQRITRHDIGREGCPDWNVSAGWHWFKTTWDKLHGAGAWKRNDWLWVLSLRRLPTP